MTTVSDGCSAYHATCQAANTGDSIFLNVEKPQLKTKPLPHTANILAYWSSAQQYLSNKPHENIRKPIITSLTLNSAR